MFAKMVLPTLGGAPAVWAVSLCFFQAMLVAGYGYAHLLEHYLAPKLALLFHLALLALELEVAHHERVRLGGRDDAERNQALAPHYPVLGRGPAVLALPRMRRCQPGSVAAAHRQLGRLFPLCREQCWQPGSATGLSAADRAALGLTAQSRIWAVGFVLLGA
jgi:hypothetical protein